MIFEIVLFYILKPTLLLEHISTPLVVQTINNMPAMQETRLQSLGWEDPLEKEMVTHFGIFVWRLPWTEEPGGL